MIGRDDLAWKTATMIHRAGVSSAVDRRVEGALGEGMRAGSKAAAGLDRYLDQVAEHTIAAFLATPGQSPQRLVGTRLLVVKAHKPGEKGVLVADYNHVFPLLRRLFDVEAIAARYHIVLEPSWVGYCTPEILDASRIRPVPFVQTVEPRDRDFLLKLSPPLVPVFPVAANGWVDHRHVPALPREKRDIDVVMVAAWASYKRHAAFFKALSGLRSRGHRLKVALVGYPQDFTLADILAQAESFGVRDQLEPHESIPRDAVAAMLARSRVHVLWSRREGSGRAIIEAMFADVPVILRDGFNFGHQYAYINRHTGRFASEDTLGDAILQLIEDPQISPRAWALEHLTCQHSTALLESVVRETAVASGEPWTEGLVPKVSALHQQEYWNPDDRNRFAQDYAFLISAIRPRPADTGARNRAG